MFTSTTLHPPSTNHMVCVCVCVCVCVLSHVRLFVTPLSVARQAPLSIGFSRPEYYSGLPFPSTGDLPTPGIELTSPALRLDSLPIESFSSVQFSSVAQSCPTLCDPMNRSMPGLRVHHQLPEFTQTHVSSHQPSHPLSFPSPPAPNPSQYQSLFQ